jgi:hypothetical protein
MKRRETKRAELDRLCAALIEEMVFMQPGTDGYQHRAKLYGEYTARLQLIDLRDYERSFPPNKRGELP